MAEKFLAREHAQLKEYPDTLASCRAALDAKHAAPPPRTPSIGIARSLRSLPAAIREGQASR